MLSYKTKIILRKSTTDDYISSNCRYSRDKELNSRRYAKLTPRGPVSIASKDLKVGDIVYVEKVNMHKNEMIIISILVYFPLNSKVYNNKHYYSRVVGYQLTCYFLERPNIREQHSSKQVLYLIRIEAVGVLKTP